MLDDWNRDWHKQTFVNVCQMSGMDVLLDNHNIQNNIGLVIFETLQAENESQGLLGHSCRRYFGHFSYIAPFEITFARVWLVAGN